MGCISSVESNERVDDKTNIPNPPTPYPTKITTNVVLTYQKEEEKIEKKEEKIEKKQVTIPMSPLQLPQQMIVQTTTPVSNYTPLVFTSKVDLTNCTYANTEVFYPPLLYGKSVKVYDGDTIWMACPLHGQVYRFNIRMYGYNSAELRTKNTEEKKKGILARDSLASLLKDKEVRIKVIKEHEKWGRVLAVLFVNIDGKEINVNKWMLDNGLGKPYDGKGAKEW